MNPYEIAAYYFPNYHPDPRNERRYGTGWTEWNLVRGAQPRFPGHTQPRVPLWGYEDESDPAVMARKIDAAADHGLTCFIFDWYHYNDGPFLDRCLERGFLGAANRERLKFALMWANHDWVELFPATAHQTSALHYPGAVTAEAFDRITDLIIERYFSQPNYWKIDGAPYFSIYELYRFIQGLGGLDEAGVALESFRRKTKAAGFPDLHLNAVVWGLQLLPGETRLQNPEQLLPLLGVTSSTSYVWIHHYSPETFPTFEHEIIFAAAQKQWRETRDKLPVPYYPNVTVGWDASPRTRPDRPFENCGYPFMSTMQGNDPAAFERALISAKDFLEEKPGPRILTLNSWNEWTEGSYLEPDTRHGLGYLEAIKKIFPPSF